MQTRSSPSLAAAQMLHIFYPHYPDMLTKKKQGKEQEGEGKVSVCQMFTTDFVALDFVM